MTRDSGMGPQSSVTSRGICTGKNCAFRWARGICEVSDDFSAAKGVCRWTRIITCKEYTPYVATDTSIEEKFAVISGGICQSIEMKQNTGTQDDWGLGNLRQDHFTRTDFLLVSSSKHRIRHLRTFAWVQGEFYRVSDGVRCSLPQRRQHLVSMHAVQG